MLRIDRLTIPGLPALSFEVAAGECLCIEGPSGSGKTRILRAIADLDPAGGQVFLEGAERAELSATEWRRRVRYVAAEPAWWADNARQHVKSGIGGSRFERTSVSLGLAHGLLDLPLTQLSTGERLRLSVARALSDEPRVILFDEPTGALDAQATALTEELIRFQILTGRAVVLVSHDVAQVGRLAHHRLLLGAATTSTAPASADPAHRITGAVSALRAKLSGQGQ